ncbi:MAG: Peptidase subtilisin kexin sedolisin [Bacteroidetes bacterium]|nr:Peptidase subtilisin kexin sedolisin [Bacteroidota bacterium]
MQNSLCVVLFFLFALPSNSWSQGNASIEFRDPETGKVDRVLIKRVEPERARLEAELLIARRSGDDRSAALIQKHLQQFSTSNRSVVWTDGSSSGVAPLPSDVVSSLSPYKSPSWGDDITVYQGTLRFAGNNREIAVYAAAILAVGDSGSNIAVFKSTDSGFSWSLVNGVQISSFRYQSFALCVTDTSDNRWVVSLLYVLKSTPISPGGSLLWTSFLDDGSGWRTSTVFAADSLTEYRNPALTTDGYAYSPPSTWHYGAAERITPTTGRSRGITAFRSSDFGNTWPVDDTTFSFGVEDAFPSIGVQAGLGTGDTVLVAFARRFSAGDNDIRLFKNSTTFSGTWVFRAVTTSLADEFAPSLSVSTMDEASLLTYTRNTGPQTQWDARYVFTTDRWGTLATGSLSSDSGKQEYLTNSAYSRSGSENQWHVSYRVVSDTATATPDTIIYKTSTDLGGISNAVPVVVNRFQDTGALRPAVGAHRQGPSGAWVGHVVFSSPGPTNLIYDGVDIPVAVNPQIGFPSVFSLGQNYPNPFNASTRISYSLSSPGSVRLVVFDILGRKITTLVDEVRQTGEHHETLDGSTLPYGG